MTSESPKPSIARHVTTVMGIAVYESDAVPPGEVHMVKDGRSVGCVIGLVPRSAKLSEPDTLS